MSSIRRIFSLFSALTHNTLCMVNFLLLALALSPQFHLLFTTVPKSLKLGSQYVLFLYATLLMFLFIYLLETQRKIIKILMKTALLSPSFGTGKQLNKERKGD